METVPNPSFFTLCSEGSDAVDDLEWNRARLGRISVKGRKTLETPNFLALTSRGVVPHISPDIVGEQTEFSGVYVAIEDCKLSSGLMPHFEQRHVLV